MERRIGDTFRYKGKWVKVHEGRPFRCDNCVADSYWTDCWDKANLQNRGECRPYKRIDGKSIVFKETERKYNIFPLLIVITILIWSFLLYLWLH